MPVPNAPLQHVLMALQRQLDLLAPDDPLRVPLQAALDAVQQRLAEGP